jgi:NAD/NADP transhydrogenase beta subunit
MADWQRLAIDIGIVGLLTAGIWQFRARRSARRGNLTGVLALAAATGVALWRDPISAVVLVAVAFAVGGLIGWAVAVRVDMVQIPAMVAFQHGCGGVAAALVSYVELARSPEVLPVVGRVSGLLGLLIGAGTFSASMVAAGKLAGRLKGTPRVLPHHNGVLASLVILALGAAVPVAAATDLPVHPLLIVMGLLAVVVGVVFAVRIGGADMPVLISFLNATAGFAAALVGVVIQNRLLIACGATVAASGSILTMVMCRAMNRPLLNVFTGLKAAPAPAVPVWPGVITEGATTGPGAAESPAPPARFAPEDPYGYAADLMREARAVVIIPGYGMALAHAQFEVVGLADQLARGGADVRFAVHPVAGRMPGHMHVLLAEADVDPDVLYEMDQVNDRLKDTDLALVVGACDVVNPAAVTTAGTPISGMPILLAYEARRVIVFNLDDRPGYSGVENPLYDDPKALLLLGDAKTTVAEVRRRLG